MPATVTIQIATETDAAWVAALCADQFYRVHEPGFVKEDLLWLIDYKFNSLALQQDIADPANFYHVAFLNQQPAGCIKVGAPTLALAKQEAGAMEVSRLYLYPHLTGQGIGLQLLHAAMQAAVQKGYASCWLHVFMQNPGARKFYEREGFNVVGTEQLLVKNSSPNGWVMMKTLV